MFEEIKAIQKTHQHTAKILNSLCDSGLFKNYNEAFVLLRATLKALRDRIEPGEAMHLAGELPALLRGFYLEGFDFSRIGRRPLGTSKDVYEFLSEVRGHLNGYDFIDLEKAVPVAMNCILDSIDKGEADQVVHALPQEIQQLCLH